jgi:MYXO-CTERM domain-containing protein
LLIPGGMSRKLRLLPLALVIAGTTVLGGGPASAEESLQIAFDTTTAGGNYDPENVVAVWIENDAGGFVKTTGRWAGTRIQHLVAWVAASGQDADAISGATRDDHSQRLVVNWDMLDSNGAMVPNGTYTIRMELADANSTSAGQNNQGTFTFVRDGQSATQNVAGGGFQNVTIEYVVMVNETCDNEVIDPGETCDPADTCPTTCAPSADACTTVTLVGSPDNCDAECLEQSILACVDGDDCCAAGCSNAEDDDCEPGSQLGGGDLTSTGCSVGSETSGSARLLLVLALGVLLNRRRRRRRPR